MAEATNGSFKWWQSHAGMSTVVCFSEKYAVLPRDTQGCGRGKQCTSKCYLSNETLSRGRFLRFSILRLKYKNESLHIFCWLQVKFNWSVWHVWPTWIIGLPGSVCCRTRLWNDLICMVSAVFRRWLMTVSLAMYYALSYLHSKHDSSHLLMRLCTMWIAIYFNICAL